MPARIVFLQRYYKVWTATVAACLAALILAAIILPKSFALTALSDVIQCLLLFSGTFSLIHHITRTRGRLRLFWALVTAGTGLWFCYQLLWVYYEVCLRGDVPDLCSGDMILFLHIVPLMAALALRPHAPQDQYAARVRHLDFAMLMLWWIYLYVFIVIPWQYVVPDVGPYNDNLNFLYLIEKIVFLTSLVVAWFGSKEGWKTFYASLFGACFTYAASSHIANWAIGRGVYYSGSLYDIPLAISMAWITVIGLWTPEREPQAAARSTSTSHGVWLARLGMIAAFSLPVFGAWALLDWGLPPAIRSFRLVLTLSAAILMGIMVFVRQRLLDRELLRLLTYSQESFRNLKRLQEQITESEKLASIGQLVGGAAHELNNPITAMLGYSDLLLLTQPLSAEQSHLASKIGQHARRTKSLVSSLLSFARPSPSTMAPVDLKTLLCTATKLSQSQWKANQSEVKIDCANEPLLIRGDSNQLLLVFVQLISDAMQVLDHSTGLIISARRLDEQAVIVMSNASSLARDAEKEAGSGELLSNLGMSACQAILREHHGRVLCESDAGSAVTVRIEIPLIAAAGNSTGAAPSAAWQPQPSA
jgi:signal transduction histidine kinase